MSSTASTTGRAGRPRASADSTSSAASALSGREQILDAAAALFSEAGFSGTSTRAIADRVGIRQQSLYYHFAGKDEILAELLSSSVRPSIEFVESIEAQVPGEVTPAGALFALASIDAGTLRRTPHNIGTLYLLPEIQDPRYKAFRDQRVQLRAIYGRLGAACAHPDVIAALGQERIGVVLIQLAEIVIQLRRNDGADTGAGGSTVIGTVTSPVASPVISDDETIAASCLRVLGLTSAQIDVARTEAATIIGTFLHRDLAVTVA
ncbi:MAG: TetR family transcriptional regulator [Glaciihabitans sp.]|nr:TetR family transcriptional regulator [Glaciihabitans sp.]